jgi:hypothetical protein
VGGPLPGEAGYQQQLARPLVAEGLLVDVIVEGCRVIEAGELHAPVGHCPGGDHRRQDEVALSDAVAGVDHAGDVGPPLGRRDDHRREAGHLDEPIAGAEDAGLDRGAYGVYPAVSNRRAFG